MTGTKDRSMPARWARANGLAPRQTAQDQLRLGLPRLVDDARDLRVRE